ncbi:MAG: LysR family transcriptional regulator [Sphingomonadales bacterium]|nr:LysR family transcriptional regulator [Sphingomonadales bacterium]
MDISLSRLLHMVVVARCGSFSAAAKELNMSQPALSRSIAAIEARYGFRLFNRVGHGVEPTAAGVQVIAQAQPLLQGLRVFDSNLHLFGSGKAGKLAIGVTPLLASALLARFSIDFLTPDGRARLRVAIRPGQDLLSMLRNDEIEICFFPEGHIAPSADLDIAVVGAVMPACIVRDGHPLTRLAQPTLADLAAFPWGSSVEPPFAPAVPSLSGVICDNYHVLRDAVLASDLVCICSEDFVAGELAAGTLRTISIDGLPLRPTTIFVARLSGRIDSPLAVEAIRRMAGYLRPG